MTAWTPVLRRTLALLAAATLIVVIAYVTGLADSTTPPDPHSVEGGATPAGAHDDGGQ